MMTLIVIFFVEGITLIVIILIKENMNVIIIYEIL